MNGDSRKLWQLLVIALVLMIGGSVLGSWINSGAGAATVSEVKIFAPNGYVVSAYLYTPDGAAPDNPVPAILASHGLNNQKAYMANTALEFARRGYAVLSMDSTGHGDSNGLNCDQGCGAADALSYLRALPFVDGDNVGLVGMSQGGFRAANAAAHGIPDGYRSIFYMESECTLPGSPDLSPCEGLKNVAFNIGSFTELGGMVLVGTGAQVPTSPVLQPVFGTTEPIVVDRLYGSIADGTARILYQPYEEHAGSTDSRAAIGNAIDWMQQTLEGGSGLPPASQIWPWKLFGTATALIGAILFIFPMGSLLLQTSYFAPLRQSTPPFKGSKGAGWWIGAFLTTAIGPLLYLWVWKGMFFGAWLPPNTLWPQSFTNIYMVWAVVVAVITIVLILANHFILNRKAEATAYNYGLTSDDGKLDWGTIGKSILLAVLTLLPIHLVLAFVTGALKVDFRAWVVALLPMSAVRFQAFLAYLIPFAIYFVPLGILFAGFLRARNGTASLRREMIVNAVVLTLGALVWLLVFYVPLMAGGSQIIAGDPLGALAAGLGGIYYIPLLVLWPLVAFLYTYFFSKTGRIYVGASLVTLFMVWYLAAFGVFDVVP